MHRHPVRSLVVSAFCFSLMALFTRLAGEQVPSFEVVFFRSLISLGLTVALLRISPHSEEFAVPFGNLRGLLLLRGLFGFGALSCFYYSVIHLPLAEATVIQFTSPIFTAVIASFYLGERAAPRLWGAIVLAFSGLLTITRPALLFGGEASPLPPGVVLVGLAGAFLTSGAHVMVRRLAPFEHELVIVLYFPLVALPASIFSVVPVWVWPSGWEWVFLLAVGLAAQGGQVFLTRGMKHLSAAGASVILYLQILFAILWGVTVLGERPDRWTLCGSLLVLAGTLVAARRPRLPA